MSHDQLEWEEVRQLFLLSPELKEFHGKYFHYTNKGIMYSPGSTKPQVMMEGKQTPFNTIKYGSECTKCGRSTCQGCSR